MIPQLWRNDAYWIDVSQSNTQSKYISIHWAALLDHTALAAALQDTVALHSEGDIGIHSVHVLLAAQIPLSLHLA